MMPHSRMVGPLEVASGGPNTPLIPAEATMVEATTAETTMMDAPRESSVLLGCIGMTVVIVDISPERLRNGASLLGSCMVEHFWQMVNEMKPPFVLAPRSAFPVAEHKQGISQLHRDLGRGHRAQFAGHRQFVVWVFSCRCSIFQTWCGVGHKCHNGCMIFIWSANMTLNLVNSCCSLKCLFKQNEKPDQITMFSRMIFVLSENSHLNRITSVPSGKFKVIKFAHH